MEYLTYASYRVASETHPKMIHELTMKRGIITSDILIHNPRNETDGHVICRALIDTGAMITSIDKKIAAKFTMNDEELKGITHLSTAFTKEHDVPTYGFYIALPPRNWHTISARCAIVDIGSCDYDAIIGLDFLKHFTFVYKGITNEAWLEY